MDAGECVGLSVQGIVAEEFEQGAVIRVAAGLGEHVDLRALMPELRGVNTDLNFELLNGVDGRKDDIAIEIRVGVIDAVEGVVVEHEARRSPATPGRSRRSRAAGRPACRLWPPGSTPRIWQSRAAPPSRGPRTE